MVWLSVSQKLRGVLSGTPGSVMRPSPVIVKEHDLLFNYSLNRTQSSTLPWGGCAERVYSWTVVAIFKVPPQSDVLMGVIHHCN